MARVVPFVTVDVRGVNKTARRLQSSQLSTRTINSRASTNPYDMMYRQWAFRYSAFARKRMNRLGRSGGGGEWKPLAPRTLAARRGGIATILRDTGTLFNGLTIGTAGNETKRIPNGVQFGFSGTTRHPNGSITIRGLAEVHQKGSRRKGIPPRTIIVKPDNRTRTGMLLDMRTAFIRGALL